jgi:hypothetical protein
MCANTHRVFDIAVTAARSASITIIAIALLVRP